VTFHVPAGVSVVGGPNPGPGPRDVAVDVADGVAAIRVVSTQANTQANPYYAVTAEISAPAGSTGAIATVKSSSGDVIAGSGGQVKLVFGADEASGVTSVLSIPTAGDAKYVGGVDKHRAQVLVQDDESNAVAGVAVRFEWIKGTVEGPGSGTWTAVTAAASDSDGLTSIEIPAPGNEAAWIWVRAYLIDGVELEPVGPVGKPTVVGAEFLPRAVDPTGTENSFATYQPAVANDLVSQSWARVVVQDDYGNGIGGVEITFTLPTSQAGTLGTPVFVDGDTPPTAKTIVVETCARNIPAALVPEECKIAGVYTPGLAYIPIVSDFEGAFAVSGSFESAGSEYSIGGEANHKVTFEAPEAEVELSSFTVAPTDAGASAVVADGVASYTVTATVMGETVSGVKPSSGACVDPVLPAHVTVKAPAPSSAGCPGGAFVTDLNGRVRFEIVTTQAGSAQIGVKLGGADIPTEPKGSEFKRSVVYSGGPPSALHSELTSPATAVRADDPAGQTVLATIRDVNGNLAACWDPLTGVQVACEVDFRVPALTWTGGALAPVYGPADYEAYTGLIDFSVANPLIALIAASVTIFGDEGVYEVTATIGGVAIQVADGVVSASGPAKARVQFLDATAPGVPVVNPSDGEHVDGHVSDEDLEDAANDDLIVVIIDEDGEVIISCPVNPDGSFDCPIVPGVPDGTELTVVIEDGEGNRTDPPVEIVTDGVAPGTPEVNPSDGGHVDGHVADEDLDDAAAGDLTVVITDEDGNVVATCPVNADGSFDCPIVPGVPDGTDLVVTIEDPAHNATEPPVEIVTDGVAPGKPTVDESDGNHVTGEVGDGDKGDAADGDLIVVVTDEDGNVIASCPVKADGTFDCPIVPGAGDGETITVEIVDPAGNASNPVNKVVDGIPPGDPTLNESNGGGVSGKVADEDKSDAAKGDLVVVVTDEDGDVVASCPVKPDGSFDCPISPKLPHGAEVTVEIVDKAGNANDSKIVVDGVAPGTPVLEPTRGDQVSGVVPITDLDDAAAGDLIVIVIDPVTGEELCQTAVNPDGTWSCAFDPALPDGTVVEVVLVDKASNSSEKGTVTVDAVAPIQPVPDPSAGETLTGLGEEEGNAITVTDADGNVLCEAEVQADRSWSCVLEPPAHVGDMLTVAEEDASHNVVTRPWRVGIPEIAIAKLQLCLGDRQAATGYNFQPGETVTAMTTGEVPVGVIKANSEGMVVFQWVVPEDTPRNVHTLTLRGPLSGVHTANFSVTCGGPPADIPPIQVPPLERTGADGLIGLTGGALGLLLAGLFLLLAAKRRRRGQEA
ncbi:MAG: Ig-like domain-containing protein, partial [Bifidobacteriaceae bacterium]|nr:Ig-like domain-containing protein [Bifidobacteriaceae bacterium]